MASCSQCAHDIEPGAVVCVHCGGPANVSPSDSADPIASGPFATRPAAPPSFSLTLLDSDAHLVGIGGWLILVALGLVFSPVLILFRTMATNVPLFTNVR